MKKLLLITSLLLATATGLYAQKYMTRTAKISFDASASGSPEKINAVNNEVAAILDGKSGDIVFQVPVKSFKFERELMQKHFNENYMESDKYPKAEFKGQVARISDINFSKNGTYNTTATGKLTIHGVTREVATPGTITVNGSVVTVKAKFKVSLSDYQIKIPGLVADKIGKEATVSLDGEMQPK
jgi:hypothetical protein